MIVHHHGLRALGFVLGLFLLTSPLAVTQTKPTAAAQAATQTANPAGVGPDTPVVTLNGFCEKVSATGARDGLPCRTVITRSEFDSIAEAGGATTPEGKDRFVQVYVQYLLFAAAAQKRGIDQDPHFQKTLELARLQLSTQMLMRDLQERSAQISPEELEKFYRENPAEFEQAALLRVYIPRSKQVDRASRVQEPIPGTEPEMKTLAEKIHARAVAGEDFENLQEEALAAANSRESEQANLGKLTRERLRQTHRGVFDLKPGEVSAVLEDPEGYYVYKVLSKSVPPLESVKEEAKTTLQTRRMDAWMKNITGGAQVSLNEQYFGASAAAKNLAAH
jgi:parvulin-like peptidyl-prolyl isomerase